MLTKLKLSIKHDDGVNLGCPPTGVHPWIPKNEQCIFNLEVLCWYFMLESISINHFLTSGASS